MMCRVFLMALTFSIVWSCSKKESNENLKIFKYNEHANINSLDPAFAKKNATIWAVNQLFEGLVQLDDSLKVVPALAKKWDISENGLIYTFYLRQDVYFHENECFENEQNTRKVIASDFEYSFKRLLDPDLASDGRWVLGYVDSFSAINDTIFKIVLKKPFPAFLGLLGMKYCSVVPKEAVEKYGNDFRSNPVGTGPFKFQLWKENVKLIFRKNTKYYEKDPQGNHLPYLDAIAITFLPDKQSEFLQLVQKNIDFINSLDVSYKDELLTQTGELNKKYEDKLNIISGPYLNTEYIGIYQKEAWLKQPNSDLILQAFRHAIDKEKLVKYLRNNMGIPAYAGFVPKGMSSYREFGGSSYNPNKSRELVSKFIKGGGKLPQLVLYTDKNYLEICEFVQKELENVSIPIEINVVPSSALRQLKATGKASMFRASWIADYPDAENYLSLFYSANFSPNGPNYTHFENSEFDTLYKETFLVNNTSSRASIYQKMDSLILSKSPVIPLYYDKVIYFVQKDIEGLEINPVNLLKLKKVRKK